jgi:ubiquinone/menaquinone biosynthesis C-methylase UbiE
MSDEPTAQQGAYFIDAESAAEMARLTKQDRFYTEAMGGLFAERSDLSSIHSILDLGCGPGQWVLDVAFAYPEIEVAGIDISDVMVRYASARAGTQRLPNASFEVMDLTKPLNFAADSFDLVNGRLLAFLAPQQWTLLLEEGMRILRPGGILRLTENDFVTTSPALDTFFHLFYRALSRAGQSFSPTGRTLGITARLTHLLRQAGYSHLHSQAHALDFSAGTAAHETMCEVTLVFLTLMQPFLLAMGVTTQEEIDRLLYQMHIEMRAEDFCAVVFLLTAWGGKSR